MFKEWLREREIGQLVCLVGIMFCIGMLVHGIWGAVDFHRRVPALSAVRAIIGEASGEGYDGMLAVACAIRNRGTLEGVYGLNASHVDQEPKEVWDDARKAWRMSHSAFGEDVTHSATHWESTDYNTPRWAKDMIVTYRVGKHVFYKEAR